MGTSESDLAPKSCPALPADLSCPECKVSIVWHEGSGRCGRCDRPFSILGQGLPSVLGSEDSSAKAIFTWPDGFIGRAIPWIEALRSGETLPSSSIRELAECGIVDATGSMTPMGRKVAYHVSEFLRQAEGDRHRDFLDKLRLHGLESGASVLDVGGGAGHTLQLLDPLQPAERICLDVDLVSLAFGCRWAADVGKDVRFVGATAHELPFRDGRFSHVICRVGLNYMHQSTALEEMARVLEPGGILYVMTEGPGFDLGLISRARNLREFATRAVDVCHGAVLYLTGSQAVPGGRSKCGRAFSTARRLTANLSRSGCDILRLSTTRRLVGLPVGFEFIASHRA